MKTSLECLMVECVPDSTVVVVPTISVESRSSLSIGTVLPSW